MLIPYRDINPTRRPPVVTVGLIVANCAVFAYLWLASGLDSHQYEGYVAQFGLIPSRFFSPEIFSLSSPLPTALTPITAMFMHGGLLHIAGNMLFLWIFGNNVEDYLGHARFFLFYLLVGIAGSAVFMVTTPTSTTPMVGASGAVAGVMGAYFVLWPHARVRTLVFIIIFFTIIELPAVVVLGIWIVMQLLEGFAHVGARSGVAWFAHIGGFFAGVGYTLIFRKKRGPPRRRMWIIQ